MLYFKFVISIVLANLFFFFNKSDCLCFYAAVVFGIISFTAFYFLKCKLAFHFFGNL